MRKYLIGTLALCVFFAGSAWLFSQGPTLTPNFGFQIPAYQQANWQVPINYDLNQIDLLLSGKALAPWLTMPNNIPLKAMNSSGTADTLLTYNASNEIVLGTAPFGWLMSNTGALIGYKSYAGWVANTSDGLIVNVCRNQTNQTGSTSYTFDYNGTCGAVSATTGYGANWGYTVHGVLTEINAVASATLLACVSWTNRLGALSECTCDNTSNLNCVVQGAGTATPVASANMQVPYRFEIVGDGSPPSNITLTVTAFSASQSFDNNMFIDLN